MSADFESFWSMYPRRVAKADAMKAWGKLTPEQSFCALQALPVHVRYWQLAGTAKEYLPYPASWIRGQRWTDELDMPQQTASNDWMKTQSGIAAKAKEIGVVPKAGEDWHSLKARILGAMR